MSPNLPSFASTLFPSLGYFGVALGDVLVVPLAASAKRLRLQLPEGVKPQVLNLKSITFHLRGEVIRPAISSVRQSTIYKNNPEYGPEGLLVGSGIHTEAEPSPWWEVEFELPLTASEIRISNRIDEYGERSRALRILHEAPSGIWTVLYDAQSVHEQLLNLLAAVRLVNGRYDFREEPPAAMRERLMRAVAESVLSPDVDLSVQPWRRLVALVDIWGEAELTMEENLLLAARLYQSDGLSPILYFARKLGKVKTIRSLQARINEVSAVRGTGSYIITRHGVKRSSLLSNVDAYLDAMRDVMDILTKAGRTPMLAYGTLLGAIRDRSFIPHDDDVDILYRCQATCTEGVALELSSVRQLLTSHGFKVNQLLPHLNMHVHDPRRRVMVDIFPCWNVNDKTQLHMERMVIRSIDTSILYPTSELEFYGRRFAIPANPEAFLLERYGKGWMRSDPFFEWPWQLDE